MADDEWEDHMRQVMKDHEEWEREQAEKERVFVNLCLEHGPPEHPLRRAIRLSTLDLKRKRAKEREKYG